MNKNFKMLVKLSKFQIKFDVIEYQRNCIFIDDRYVIVQGMVVGRIGQTIT